MKKAFFAVLLQMFRLSQGMVLLESIGSGLIKTGFLVAVDLDLVGCSCSDQSHTKFALTTKK